MDKLPNRHSIRIKGYDYSLPGDYFITICTSRNGISMSDVENYSTNLSKIGEIVERMLLDLQNRFNIIVVDYVIMPNHIHFIYSKKQKDEKTVQNLVGASKSITTIEINKITGKAGDKIWQRGFYEEILETDDEIVNQRIEYIDYNPLEWQLRVENQRAIKF